MEKRALFIVRSQQFTKTLFIYINYQHFIKGYPKTGRTHQIRIHLQYLGFPILNDPLYNQPTVWGINNGKDGIYEFTKEQIETNFLSTFY